jgi:hypothetical protein
MVVPPFERYDFITPLNSDQERFLEHWRQRWEQRQAVDLGSNAGYLYEYLKRFIKEPKDVIRQLPELLSSYRDVNDGFAWLCQRWIADYYLLQGDYERALVEYPPLKLGATATHAANELLNAKRLVGAVVRASDLFALVGPKLTPWGKSNISAIASEFESLLERLQKELGESLIGSWSRGENSYGWHLFCGISKSFETPRLKKPFYCYYTDKEISDFVTGGIRDAENRARVDQNIPKVGEGWVSETTLYYQIKRAFPDHEVLHHARPDWIGRQHLDIYIPEVRVALEYQGPQHDRPVDFFGGEEQLRQTKKRDSAKLKKCIEAGVILIYVREGYALEAIVKEITDLATALVRSEIQR